MPNTTPIAQGFYGLGIAPKLLDILDQLKYKTPTPIQQQSIPIAIAGTDVMGIAQTGTGKTLAFGIPLIQRLAQIKGMGLVVLPTRELALQVDEEFRKIGRGIGLRTAVLIGGASMYHQLQDIKRKPHVLIVTPGRLIDHLDQKTVRLDTVSILVLDEADRMLDMGFAPQIKRILQAVPKERQTMLFSATMPGEIVHLASSYMKLPVRVEIARAGTAAENITQEMFVVKKEDKLRLLEKVLTEHRGSVLVFSRTKHGAKRITRSVQIMGHAAAEIHSNRSLNQRREALEGFKSGKYRVLVATDIAARGIDVKGIELVINFDLPDQAGDYVHRIGRTGRAGRSGHAISFATPDQGRDVREIEKLTRTMLPVAKLPELPPHRAQPSMPVERRFSRAPVGRGYSHARSSSSPSRSHHGGRPFRGSGSSSSRGGARRRFH
ncbi:MAG: DEAD/DEAH box helicase [Candidatus Uhrbacteria bacterium]|nr:DEAD/DEAH box helicase [Candidatus Uhrbacteria bacterium]